MFCMHPMISNTGTDHFIMRTVDARMGASVVMQNQIKRHVVLPILPFHYCCPPHNLLKCSKPMRPTTLTANSPPLKNETNPPSCSNGNTTKVLLILCLKAQRSYHQQWYRTSRQKCAETRLAIDLERNFQRNHSDDSYWLWTLPPCTLPPHRGCRPAATHQCKSQSGHSWIGYISCPSNQTHRAFCLKTKLKRIRLTNTRPDLHLSASRGRHSNLAAVGSTAFTSDVAREEITAVINRQFFLACLHVLLGDNLVHGHGLQDSRFCSRYARSLVPLQRPRP